MRGSASKRRPKASKSVSSRSTGTWASQLRLDRSDSTSDVKPSDACSTPSPVTTQQVDVLQKSYILFVAVAAKPHREHPDEAIVLIDLKSDPKRKTMGNPL